MIIGYLGNCPIGYEVLEQAATAAGTTQATATPLNALTSIVTTVPPGSGVQVIRPARFRQMIINAGTNPLNVWPLPGMSLYPAATNEAVTLQPGRTLGLVVDNDQSAFIVFNTSSFS